jgi:hypothetical protein
MTVALILLIPPTVLAVFSEPPNPLRLPSGDQVSGAVTGWVGEGYSLVAVTPFVPPPGQESIGPPSYVFNNSGDVVEVYATQSILIDSSAAVAASYAAKLRRQSAAAQKKGQVWSAVRLLLKAQGISS